MKLIFRDTKNPCGRVIFHKDFFVEGIKDRIAIAFACGPSDDGLREQVSSLPHIVIEFAISVSLAT
ncbi:hypothetical protein V22_11330 [Calycomorphotria hydatis]|uniref:Uncharacterized protein n=1 Tax=Calycomorphotria hydatis TaxID=2528027 RepID=A0A517T6A0_9PLAN|nr:hypothetical protein V22_11330 [Calycomorphotria hydatis]